MTQPRPALSPSVALVLGSGGARGMSHLGVLQALDELGLAPGIAVGTSIGSLAAAAYATGCAEKVRKDFLSMGVLETSRLFVEPGIPRTGLIEGRRAMEKIGEWVPDVDIAHLRIAYAAVAFDIVSQTETVLDSGSLHAAIRASISIPGVFTPVRHGDGAWLVDGGLSNPLPVSVARDMGARRVLAVDINLVPGAVLAAPQGDGTKLSKFVHTMTGGAPTIVEVLLQSIRVAENAIERERLQKDAPDLLLSIPVGHIQTLDFRNPEAAVRIGYDCVMEKADAIRALFQD